MGALLADGRPLFFEKDSILLTKMMFQKAGINVLHCQVDSENEKEMEMESEERKRGERGKGTGGISLTLGSRR